MWETFCFPGKYVDMSISGQELRRIAEELRIWIVEMLTAAGSGHPGGSLSAIDLLTVLWFTEMRGVQAGGHADPGRDRFVLSKGHGVPALYAVLAKLGFIPKEELMSLRRLGSRLQGHPDRMRIPMVEASTGSLGQGLSVAQGLALAMKLDRTSARVYCMLGDGEIQEGQVWEAAMSAPKFALSNLCAILDYNQGQIDGHVREVMPIEPLADKWRAFGWEVLEIDGHDFPQIQGAFSQARKLADQGSKRPVLILAHTVKGKGVSFMEDLIKWHGVTPKPDEAQKAIAEIQARLTQLGGVYHG